MTLVEALILGTIQGLTEFLPISSSGHLEIAKAIMGHSNEKGLIFTVVVHGATVLSTIVVFRKEILKLILALYNFKWSEDTRYILKLAISAVPIAIVGLLFQDDIENYFFGNTALVGAMLLLTGLLLLYGASTKSDNRNVSNKDALVIGAAQVLAILPGISRSGATIATALISGISREEATKFSFLMVLAPVVGANIKAAVGGDLNQGSVELMPLVIGFLAAFISGIMACKWMLAIVKRGKLKYFAIYCFLAGSIAIVTYFV